MKVIKGLAFLFVVGFSTAVILGFLVSVATSIYTSQKNSYSGLYELRSVYPTIDICSEVESGALQVIKSSCGDLQVTTNASAQPFGRSYEDEITAAEILQPADYSKQTTINYQFLQGSRNE